MNKHAKGLKPMFDALTAYMGGSERDAGMLIAILLDLLKALTKDGPRELRTMKLELNGFFSVTYDFAKDEVVDETV